MSWLIMYEDKSLPKPFQFCVCEDKESKRIEAEMDGSEDIRMIASIPIKQAENALRICYLERQRDDYKQITSNLEELIAELKTTKAQT